MSFFKKVNDTEETPDTSSTEDQSTSYSDVNTEISDLDSLLDKVLAEKKAERPVPSDDGEIQSVKVADLLSGKTASSQPEEPEPVVINEEAPAQPEDDDNNSKYDTVDTDDTAASLLGEEKSDTASAASILADETPYESSADDVLSGHDSVGTEEKSDTVPDTASSYESYVSPEPYETPESSDNISDSIASDNTEDALLVQIDAFRDKAIRLSGLINANQKKVMSLEAEVKKKEGQISDKENQIAALQEELSKKQKEADALVTTVETQVDRMLVSVKREMSSLNDDISGKISRENKEESAKIAGVIDRVNSSVLEIKEYLAHAQEDTSLEEVKEELSEKIHSENVKVYRNIQDTIKEMDHSEQLDISIDEKYRSLKHRSAFMLIVLIVNLGISAVMLLMRIGIIPDNILSLLGL